MEPITFIVAAGLLTLLSGVVGIGLGRYVWPSVQATHATALSEAQIEAARLSERVAGLERQLDDETEKRASAERDEKAAATEVARLAQRETDLTAQLAELQTRLTSEFENIANRILKANASELSSQSQSELKSILEPLRQRIQDFQTKVETTYQQETREVLSLKEQIRLVLETSHSVGSKADNLASAMRAQSHVRGRWGEVVLERILEAAGLSEGRDYIVQGRGLGLRNEEGGLQKPDVVIQLPQKRTMVIDSKVPLIGYERLNAASNQDERDTAGVQFVRDVKNHIAGLSDKRYQDNIRLAAHDCVLMFVPMEGALAAALSCDPELFLYGWDRRVVLVGPSTLLMTMRTVASLRDYELQNHNAQEIARLAGSLLDKVSAGLDDLNRVAGRLADAAAAHGEAMRKLSTGRGNALSIGGRIRALGVKAKAFPQILVDGGAITEAEWEGDEIPVLAPSPATEPQEEQRPVAAE
jgi:DNA recombination protein RmuC